MIYSFPVLSTPPIYPLEESYEDLIIKTGYEAGYDHTRPKYSNAFRRTFIVSYSNLTDADKLQIERFLSLISYGENSFFWFIPDKQRDVIFSNGKFENDSDLNGWAMSGNGSIEINSNDGYLGNSMKLNGTTGSYGIVYKTISFDINQWYLLRAYSKTDLAASYANIGTFGTNVYFYSYGVENSSEWKKRFMLFKFPISGANQIRFFRYNSSVSSGYILVDDVQLHKVDNSISSSYLSGNLIANGTFDASTSGWTPTSGVTLTSVSGGVSGNCLQLDSVSTGGASCTVDIDKGKWYYFSGWIKSGTAGSVNFTLDAGGTGIRYIHNTQNDWTKFEGYFYAEHNSTNFRVHKESALSGTVLFDEACLYEVSPLEKEVRLTSIPKFSYVKKGSWNCEFSLVEA